VFYSLFDRVNKKYAFILKASPERNGLLHLSFLFTVTSGHPWTRMTF